MLLGAFISWWYGPGWKAEFDKLGRRINVLVELFSIPILFKTLFAPWKQIVDVASKDQALNMKMQAVLGNMISRFVGFWVRLIVLFTGIMSLLVSLIIGLIWIVSWPFIPLLIPVLVVAATGVF